MAYVDTTWYLNAGDQSTTGYYAVTKWATGASIAAGVLRRQNAAPAVGSERVFVCVVAGTTHATTEPTWVLTRGAKTTDNTVTWQECTGASAVNGDLTNTPNWTAQKALGAPSLGSIIKRNNGASYQICTTVGSMAASEPSFSDTAGMTTSDGTSVWTSLGVVGNFVGGGAPHARLATVMNSGSWWVAGNTIYVGDNHAESQATAITISPAPNLANTPVNKILCHNHSGSYPPATGDLTTGATISTTGAANISLNWANGSIYLYGLTFKGGVGQSSGGNILFNTLNVWTYFDNCSLQILSTGGGVVIQFSSANNVCTFILNNTTVFFGNSLQKIDLQQGTFIYQNTALVLASGSVVPSTFIYSSSSGQGRNVLLEALDLSQITGTIFSYSSDYSGGDLLKDCKLNAAASIVTVATNPGPTTQVVRSDSGATGYKSARYSFDGTETTETSITRTGGATDPTGQAQSRKIVATANSQWLRPFKAEPYAIWNPTTGANVTVTVYGIANDTAVPNNDDAWMEVEYLGSSSTPLGTIVNTTKASVLAANSAGTADTSAWDANVTARANSHAYVIGDIIKVASNPGRVFFNTSGSGTSAASEPGGFAIAVDGGTVTDGSVTFRAGCRFKLAKTLSSPQPGLAGYLEARVSVAKPSTTYYVDPKPVLT